MEFLILLEESLEHSPVLARVDSVPASLSSERRARDVVTLYGTPNTESLALALAAAVESHRVGDDAGAVRHLGLWPARGAIGDAAWRDEHTGDLVTRDLDIPLETLAHVADRLIDECGSAFGRLVAGLSMPDWPEGQARAMSITLPASVDPTRTAAPRFDGLLDLFREADRFTYEYEGD